MEEPKYFLTEQDAQVIKEMVQWWRLNKDRIERLLTKQEERDRNLSVVNDAARRGFSGK